MLQGYYTGNGTAWAPIMGVAYNRKVSVCDAAYEEEIRGKKKERFTMSDIGYYSRKCYRKYPLVQISFPLSSFYNTCLFFILFSLSLYTLPPLLPPPLCIY